MYKTMYYHLFNAVTDAIELLEDGQTQQAIARLEAGQQQTEDLYIQGQEIIDAHRPPDEP